jgi:hypothetical protein
VSKKIYNAFSIKSPGVSYFFWNTKEHEFPYSNGLYLGKDSISNDNLLVPFYGDGFRIVDSSTYEELKCCRAEGIHSIQSIKMTDELIQEVEYKIHHNGILYIIKVERVDDVFKITELPKFPWTI